MRKLILLTLIFSFCIKVNATEVLGTKSDIPWISQSNEKEYRVQIDDTFNFYYHGDIEKSYKNIAIFPNGTITIPEYKEVKLVGMTIVEIRKLIKEELGYDNDVIINHSKTNISVLGEVKSPGSYKHNDIKTVYDAIAKAGGFTKIAKKSEVWLIRQRIDGTRVSYIIDFPKDVFSAYQPGEGIGKEAYLLQEGDLIYVAKSSLRATGSFVLKAMNIATLGILSGVFTAVISNAID